MDSDKPGVVGCNGGCLVPYGRTGIKYAVVRRTVLETVVGVLEHRQSQA